MAHGRLDIRKRARFAETPFEQNMATHRVAVAKEDFKTTLTQELEDDLAKRLLALLDSTQASEKFTMELAVVDSVTVEGPGCKILSSNEWDALLAESDEKRLVPIKGTSDMALLPEWEPCSLLLNLMRDEDAETPVLTIEVDEDSLHVRSQETGTVCQVDLSAEAHRELLELLSGVKAPKAVPDVDRSPAREFNSDSRSKSGAGARDGATMRTYALPAFVGEMAIRFFSNALRMHVLTLASLDEGMRRPMALDGCYLTRLPGVAGKYQPKTRVSFNFHRASCRCLCGVWNGRHGTAGAPKKLGVVLEFCGNAPTDGCCCALHPDDCKSVAVSNGKRVCVSDLKLSVVCLHGENASKGKATTIAMPSRDPFLKLLAASCAALCDPDAVSSDESIESTDRVLNFLAKSYCKFRESLEGGEDPEVLRDRDASILSMLCSGSFFYGSRQRNGAAKLRCRDGVGTPPAALARIADSHSYLFPPN